MNWPDDFNNKVICGDCLEIIKAMPDECVDMVMTSPPYWGLRDYGIGPDQLGLEPTPELYIEHLTEIFNEAKRVLKKEGTLWLNIGDTYWGGKGKSGYPLPHDEDRRYKEGKTLQHGYQVPGYMEMRPPDGKHDFIQPKCLTMIPERLAWSLIQNGWILRNKIIWYKPNSMPSSVKDRFSNRWEGLFLLVKSSKAVYWTNRKTGQLVTKQPLGIKGQEGMDWEWEEVGVVDKDVFNVKVRDADKGRFMQKASKEEKESYGKSKLKKASLWIAHDYYFDLDAVREPHKYDGRKDTLYKGGPKDMQIGKHERWPDPAGKNPGDVINVERKWDEVPGQVTQSIARDHGGWFRKDGTPIVDFDKGKNPGDFWNINTQPFPEAHFAVFPEALCEKPIKAGCPEKVCKKCGKAREKIVKEQSGKAEKRKRTKAGEPKGMGVSGIRSLSGSTYQYPDRSIIGFTCCSCNAGFEGGIVLDPFAGAGTVGVVTKKLGRRFILIDIKKEYCEMAERRIAKVGYQMELRV